CRSTRCNASANRTRSRHSSRSCSRAKRCSSTVPSSPSTAASPTSTDQTVRPPRNQQIQTSVSPVRLNHAVLFVADLDRSLQFYTDLFGMEIVAREPRANAAFLRLPRSGNHHDLGLFGVGDGGPPKRRGAIGLYHLAWQLDTVDELVAARQALIGAGAYTGESSHGATKSLYGADPDGNEFELMWMLPREEWGPYENAAPIDHLDLTAEVRRWSGVRTAGSITPDTQETPS